MPLNLSDLFLVRFISNCNQLQYGKYENSTQDDIMKNHAPKSVPDRVLKGLILDCMLTALKEDRLLTAQEIHNIILTTPKFFETPEIDVYGKPLFSGKYTYNSLPGVRSCLSYLKKSGYVSLYNTDDYGNIIRKKQKRPYVWYLTPDGEVHGRDTFSKLRFRVATDQKIIDANVANLLSQDEQVQHIAGELFKEWKKLNPKPPRERLRAKSWTVKPHRNKIGIQHPKTGKIKEYEVTKSGDIKELEDLKSQLIMKHGKVNVESTIMSLQNEIEAMRKVLAEADIRYEKQSVELAKHQGRKTARSDKEFIRQMDRMGISTYYYEAGMVLDAQFFEIWGGSMVVVEYKRLLEIDGILNVYYDIQSTGSEIMTRTEFSKRILELDEVPDVQIQVTEIRDGSIEVDSPWFNAPKTLKL